MIEKHAGQSDNDMRIHAGFEQDEHHDPSLESLVEELGLPEGSTWKDVALAFRRKDGKPDVPPSLEKHAA